MHHLSISTILFPKTSILTLPTQSTHIFRTQPLTEALYIWERWKQLQVTSGKAFAYHTMPPGQLMAEDGAWWRRLSH